MNLLLRFQNAIREQNLFSSEDKLLLTVSGGVDSVVLCELCRQAGYHFAIAHCNFQLRGEESDRDEQFVRGLANKYGVDVFIKKFDTEKYANEKKISIQEAARNLRYRWFFQIMQANAEELAKNDNLPNHPVQGWHVPHRRCYVVTAHHADDNIETMLMNFFRGTGLHGLTGIPAISDTGTENWTIPSTYLRRPLLPFTKDELIEFAKINKLEHVEDSSNQSSKYTRNFFRNEILPAIRTVYPQVKENLLDNIDRFIEIEKLYNTSVDEIKKRLCKQKGDEIHIPIKQLMGFRNRALIYEIIRPYGFSEKQVNEVLKLAESDSGKYIQSASRRIIRHRHWFIISPVMTIHSDNIIIEEKDKSILFEQGSLQFEVTGNLQPETGNHLAFLDSTEISFPLLLRKWKPGDYFYPLGIKKKKKLARFFIDQKLSKTDKEKAWVIEMNNKIIWVVGHRIDDRFIITNKTKTYLKITYSTKS
jgi:tRNA(Ile)-lysidine synthase